MTTLREIVDILTADDPAWLDAELTIQINDGHRNVTHATPKADLWKLPRQKGYESTGEPARLQIAVLLDDCRLVREQRS